jgi:hypothetical protein
VRAEPVVLSADERRTLQAELGGVARARRSAVGAGCVDVHRAAAASRSRRDWMSAGHRQQVAGADPSRYGSHARSQGEQRRITVAHGVSQIGLTCGGPG